MYEGSDNPVDHFQLYPKNNTFASNEEGRVKLVGVTFVWPYPGNNNNVLITGSFFNWTKSIDLHRREGDT